MRILMTADTVGGVWTYCMELIQALRPLRVEVVLATMGAPPRPDQRAAVDELGNARLLAGDYRLEWMDEPWDDVERAGDWLLALERECAPDLVHLNGYAHGALPWRAPSLVVGHSCVLSWWRAVRGVDAPPAWDRYRDAVRAGLTGATAVAAPTAWMLDQLRRLYGVPSGGHVIHNGRDPAGFGPGESTACVLSAGRLWDEGKNLRALDAAAAQVPWPVYVAGDTSHPSGGKVAPRHARALGPLVPRMLAGWLGLASIYALPARYEPFGLSPVEAALSGCALVLGDIESLREVWGDAASFVPPGDPDAIASALRALIAEPDRRAAMAQRARRRAGRYTPGRMAAGYLSLYSELLSPTKGARLCAS